MQILFSFYTESFFGNCKQAFLQCWANFSINLSAWNNRNLHFVSFTIPIKMIFPITPNLQKKCKLQYFQALGFVNIVISESCNLYFLIWALSHNLFLKQKYPWIVNVNSIQVMRSMSEFYQENCMEKAPTESTLYGLAISQWLQLELQKSLYSYRESCFCILLAKFALVCMPANCRATKLTNSNLYCDCKF